MASLSKGGVRIGIGLVVVALAAGGWFYFGNRKMPVKFRFAEIERGAVQVSVTATGTLQAVVTVQVGTQVSGSVSAIYADFNSQVKKNQVIARIDSTLLKAALTDASSNVEKAAAQERQASQDLQRTQALFDRTLVSQSDLDQSTANARVAAANLSSARAQVDRARINLRYATILSPIDGIVLSRAVDVGQTVAASFNTPTLFTIAGDLRQMQVLASVDEADIGKIAVGQSAAFTVDAYPDSSFTGEVKQIRLQPVTVQNVVSYDVLISVPNPLLKLMPGMTANLTIAVDRKDDALLAPTAALRFMPPDWEGKKGGKGGWDKSKQAQSASAQGVSGQVGNPGGYGNRADTSAAKSPDSSGKTGGWKKPGGKRDGAGEVQGQPGRADSGSGHGHGSGNWGRVFVLENGKPKPVRVHTGISDGAKTEITGDLEPGTQVIVGIESTAPKAPTGSSPLGMPRIGGGGGGGGGARGH